MHTPSAPGPRRLSSRPASPPLLMGGGEMGARIRALDWSGTPLGPPDTWPQALLSVLSICLHSSFPTAVYWGPDLRLLYNDAWAPIPAEKHPWALGRPAREVWDDIWEVVGPQFAEVLSTGEGFSAYSQMLLMQRGGKAVETYWNYSFTPIRRSDGAVAGIFNQGHEITTEVVTRRALQESQERLRQALSAGNGIGTWDWDVANDRVRADEPFARLYGVDPQRAADGAPIAEFFRRVHPDDIERVKAEVAECLRAGGDFASEYRLLRSDGTVCWTVAQGRCVLDQTGRPMRFPGVSLDISERKQAEEALRESEAQKRLALEAAEVGTWDYRPNTGELRWNERCKALFGLPPDAPVTYETFLAGCHPDDRVRMGEAVARATDPKGDGRIVDEYRAIGLRDGVQRWLVTQGQASFENSVCTRFVGVVLDITHRKAAEAALRESEARFRLVADSAPVMLWMGDHAGKCVYLNRAQREFWGVDASAIETFDWSATLHPDDSEALFEPFGQAMRDRTAFTVEARYRRQDGQYRILRTEAQPRFGADNDFLGMIGVNVDVTETRLAEEALLESEARFRAITNSIDQMIWSTRPDGHHDYYNDRWYEFTGVPRGSTDGDAWNGMFHPDDQARARRIWRNCLETGEPYHIEYRLRHRSGAYRWVLGRAQAVRGKDGRVVRWFGTCTDIQEIVDAREVLARSREELEQRIEERTGELMRTEQQLRQLQKMEAVGQLTGGIAHDFNNMLAVVIGGLNLLQRRLQKGDTNVDQFVEAAMDGARRAASLTQRLLAFSRQQPLAPEPIDANRMVADMTELLTRTIGETVKVETVLNAGLWTAKADPVQLENAILNLSVNARDAMPEGGKLTIETANAYVDEDYAREFEIAAGQYVLIAVTDSGAGMPPDVMAKAFEPFFTTKAVGKGTGLGLSQVFGFVRQSGGHVKIYSEVGVGTTVKIYLPRHYGDAPSSAPRRAAAPLREGSAEESVLVVEDEERVRNYSVQALKDLGYAVIEAANGPEAMRVIEAGARVNLLFTDIVMPEMTGRQLADLAMAKLPKLKVLFTTGYTRNAVVHNDMLDPGTNYLPKPFSIEQLARKVRAALDT